MKHKRSFVLDEKDDKAVQLFAELGMPKNLAKTLMFISQVEECRSADVEQGADLRQPEVSVAMQEMRRRGWAKKRDLKKKGNLDSFSCGHLPDDFCRHAGLFQCQDSAGEPANGAVEEHYGSEGEKDRRLFQ